MRLDDGHSMCQNTQNKLLRPRLTHSFFVALRRYCRCRRCFRAAHVRCELYITSTRQSFSVFLSGHLRVLLKEKRRKKERKDKIVRCWPCRMLKWSAHKIRLADFFSAWTFPFSKSATFLLYLYTNSCCCCFSIYIRQQQLFEGQSKMLQSKSSART